MKMGERAINNALFNAGSSVLPLALSFVFWPYIVSSLGESAYGIYALVGSVIGYFALLDLGLGNAVIKYVAEYVGQKDEERVVEVIGTAGVIFLTAGLFGGLLILAIAGVLVTRLLKIPPELVEVAYVSFCIAALGFLFTMLVYLFTAVTNGLNRYDISGITMAVTGMGTTLGAVILLKNGFGLVSLVWLNVVLSLLATLYYVVVIHRLLPDIPLCLMVKPKILRDLFHFGMYSILSRVTDVVMCQVGPLLIGMVLGLTSVTYYVVPFTILNRLTVLIIRIGTVIFPAVSELQGSHRQGTICELYITALRMILSISTAITVPLLVFGIQFLSLWMSPEFAENGGTVLLWITLGVFIDQSTNVPCFVVNGLGRPKISGFMAAARALIFLGLLVPAATFGGIVGVAAAFTVSNALVSPVFIWFVSCRVLGLSLRQLVKEVYLRPLLAGFVVAVGLLFVPQQRIENLFVILGAIAGGTALYFIVALLVGVYQERERRVFAGYLKSIWLRIRKKGGPE